ncbi:MAG: glycoside hydrolase family 3 C-terminal domain-containing protein [Clostridia bacterium]|nr:glycoside hydrolase family 3 C-terminal domain-containing protein [Clostridia bacterium]
MKFGSWISPLRGVTAVMAAIMALSVTGYALADSWRGSVDDMLGTSSYEIDDSGVAETEYKSTYSTAAEMMQAAKDISIKEGQEGTVVMKNDNSALPIQSGTTLAFFGLASYGTYEASDDLNGGNADAVTSVYAAFEDAGFTVNEKLQEVYNAAMNRHQEEVDHTYYTSLDWVYDIGPQTTVGDMTTFNNNELSVDDIIKAAKAKDSSITVNSTSDLGITKDETVGIVTIARAGGESNTYLPLSQANLDSSSEDYLPSSAKAVLSSDGKTITYEGTTKDALELSDSELAVIKTAKSLCSKVIVLLNTSNDMMISSITTSGDYEADAIAYIGVPNDYQLTGVVNVLDGTANSTGALTDTYVVNNESLPSMQNFGGDYYSDYTLVNASSTNGWDSRWGEGAEISNKPPVNSFSANDDTGNPSYSGGQYIVEAEGIYVGYKYYETRYYDSIMDASGTSANDKAGSTTGNAWSYDDEVVYPFGYGQSYLDYTQEVDTSKNSDGFTNGIKVDKLESGAIDPDGYTTVAVKVTNNTDEAGYFLAELYVSQPYTSYDQNNAVEKSAIMFLNSKKVTVAANSSQTVEISVMTKYLASYDYTTANNNNGGYILDYGVYYFTAANGSHEAVQNVIKEVDSTKLSDYTGTTVGIWKYGEGTETTPDTTTFATDNGTTISNAVEDYSDMNSWISGSVKYLTRSDWTTFPINYNEQYYSNDTLTTGAISLAKSTKTSDWVAELRGQTYTITETEEQVENVDGIDLGYEFNIEQLNAINETTGRANYMDIDNDYWTNLVAQLSVNEAVGAIIHGGSQTDNLKYVNNPVISQHEGVNGFSGTSAEGYNYNVSSQTLLGSSFNPDLALEWGEVEGNSGLWLQYYNLWGTGLTQRRTPYNGRNYEYISEDPMLTNAMGYGIIKGTLEFGILCGPKHIGFNDQEHNRNGIAAYMNEQKFRETDLRGFQGGMEDANGLAVMVAFNRIGPMNACHSQGMLKQIMRGEWGYKGLISTDMMNDCYYFNPESIVMATVTQVADFSTNDSYISATNSYNMSDASWSYLTINKVKVDNNLVTQAREDMKYQLYAFANSAVRGVETESVTPWWEAALIAVIAVSATLFAVGAVALVTCTVFKKIKKEED